MNKILLIFVAMFFVAIISVVKTSAQVTDALVADIPFDFTVRDKTLPAGHYIVKALSDSNHHLMIIRTQDGKAETVFATESAYAREAPHEGELIFNRVGNHYFLYELFDPWQDLGAMLPKSHAEHVLEKEVAKNAIESVIIPTSTIASASN